jgi:predicted dienelactone hydrolase
VLFSPGFGTPPLEYTSRVEDLASHGYVVVMIYHTYSAPATICANGRFALLTQAGFRSENEPPGTSNQQTDADRNSIGRVWVADARFTRDQLTSLNESDPVLHGHLDLGTVGVFGHSFGGATAADVCQHDVRFEACANLDGTVFSLTQSSGIRQPFI